MTSYCFWGQRKAASAPGLSPGTMILSGEYTQQTLICQVLPAYKNCSKKLMDVLKVHWATDTAGFLMALMASPAMTDELTSL